MIDRGGRQLIADDLGIEKKTTVFSTKKLSEAQAKLFHNDIAAESSDFIKIRFNRIAPKVIKSEIENVILTSKNGVEAVLHNFTKDELQFKNIFCVGRRTKKLIEQKLGAVKHVAKNAGKLAEYLSEEIKGQEVTYFCSDIRLDTLPTVLSENGIIIHEVEAYKTMYSPATVGDKVGGVLFYSPSTVASYVQKNSPDTVAFCIGESTAKEAKKYFKKVEIAKVPTVESVIELVNLYYVQ